ncbi:SDR family NAD(P)-dependent oxidoreductase [Streptomyces specialis]|uniref:SDR family NAD(P)-dependent oxidoreductase n=1 Tax=Streptomyces specialis TaxID=498367 RepID=UPI00073E188C|nr:SDR family NAD(P)-dependent oxidoreductase [Streptomyces specialis]
MKVALVTGAAGAIGAATCAALLEHGYRVVAVDVDRDGLDRLPGPVTRLCHDLTDPAAPGDIAAALTGAGRLDVLVHNAGVCVTTPFEQATTEEIAREQQVNLHAPILLTRALFGLLRQSSGHIVAVVSLASQLPLAQSPGYSASKFGLRGFLLALAMREKETGVRISIINPGAVDTPMLRREAATGGSPLNFLSTPLSARAVADAVTARLGRPRLETNLPRHDGWLIRTGMLAPALIRWVRPALERVARPAHRAYLRKNDTR